MLFWKLQHTLEDDTLCQQSWKWKMAILKTHLFSQDQFLTTGFVGGTARNFSFRQIVPMNFNASVLKQPHQRRVFWEIPSDGHRF